MEGQKTVWDILSEIDCSKYIEQKQGLSYLNWAWAWGIVKKNFPDASYKDVLFDGKPYLYDESLGYMVATEVTIKGETLSMNLPVMDGANKTQKNADYVYKTKSGDKTVLAATMFDINTAQKRCLVKNIAMFGLGHFIYAKDVGNTKKIEKAMTELRELRIDNTEDFEKVQKAFKNGYSINDIKSKWKITPEVEAQLKASLK